ncbi:MAG: helix-turn-helix transcriptional regulator [Thermoflexales bacterium]|nr:helix-turn-helix transcriptional regulator [Thermoflexales bacterium]
MDTQSFVNWLNGEIETRGWSYRELARRGGLSHGSISLVANGQQPGPKVCIGIAQAFGISTSEVLYRAGHLPTAPRSGEDPTTRELMDIIKFLDDKDLGMLLRMAQALLKEEAQKGASKRAAKKLSGRT